MKKADRERDQYAVVLENVRSKFDFILEALELLPRMQQTIDATFEEVGKLRVDMEAVKEFVRDHGHRLVRIEQKVGE